MEMKEQIQNILENVPKVYEAGRRSFNAELGETLKGCELGDVVSINDISPFEHEMKVKLTPNNFLDIHSGEVATGNPYDFKVEDDSFQLTVETTGSAFCTIKFTINEKRLFGKTITLSWDAEISGYAQRMAGRIELNGEIVARKDIKARNTFENMLVYTLPKYNEGDVLKISFILSTYSTDRETSYMRIVQPQLAIGDNLIPQYGRTDFSNVRFFAQGYYSTPQIKYPVNADGTVEGVKSIYPTTKLFIADPSGALIEVEYIKDITKAFAELQQIILSLGGSI